MTRCDGWLTKRVSHAVVAGYSSPRNRRRTRSGGARDRRCDRAEGIRRQWEEWEPGVELVTIPELVASRWWEHLLHNQTALRLKANLLFHPGIVVANVPYHVAARRSHAVAASGRGPG